MNRRDFLRGVSIMALAATLKFENAREDPVTNSATIEFGDDVVGEVSFTGYYDAGAERWASRWQDLVPCDGGYRLADLDDDGRLPSGARPLNSPQFAIGGLGSLTIT